MKHHPYLPFISRLLGLALGLAAGTAARAQQMPQDNWRNNGLQFASPTPTNTLSSIAIGSGGVYVGENNPGIGYYPNNILQFTEGGVFVRRFTAAFTQILGIACDPAGNVYVLDQGDSKVHMFDQNGTFIRQWGGAGTGDGQFSGLSGGTTMIAVDKNSQVYVCDPGNSRVQVFDSSGNFLRKWGQAGTLPSQFSSSRYEPNVIAVSASGSVYVSSNYTYYPAKVFDSVGNYQTSVQSGGISYFGTVGLSSVSSDGLVAVHTQQYSYYGLGIADPVSGYFGQDIGLQYTNDSAFSKRGNLFVIDATSGKKVLVFEREYSSVQNSLLPTAIPEPIILANSQRSGTSWMDIDY